MSDYAFGFKCTLRNKSRIQNYMYYLYMAKEFKVFLWMNSDIPQNRKVKVRDIRI